MHPLSIVFMRSTWHLGVVVVLVGVGAGVGLGVGVGAGAGVGVRVGVGVVGGGCVLFVVCWLFAVAVAVVVAVAGLLAHGGKARFADCGTVYTFSDWNQALLGILFGHLPLPYIFTFSIGVDPPRDPQGVFRGHFETPFL